MKSASGLRQALPIPAERMARAVGSAPYDLGGFVVAPVERMEGVLAYYAPMTPLEQRAGIEFRSRLNEDAQ